MRVLIPSGTSHETVAEKITSETDENNLWLVAAMEDPSHDDNILAGLQLYLEQCVKAPFLNSLKLERRGEWLGNNAPDRLQIRLSEAARSSQHPAFAAFRTGLSRSGGLERAFPPAKI